MKIEDRATEICGLTFLSFSPIATHHSHNVRFTETKLNFLVRMDPTELQVNFTPPLHMVPITIDDANPSTTISL